MTALSLMRLLPDAGTHRVAGRSLLDGADLLALVRGRHARACAASRMAMIFQEPATEPESGA